MILREVRFNTNGGRYKTFNVTGFDRWEISENAVELYNGEQLIYVSLFMYKDGGDYKNSEIYIMNEDGKTIDKCKCPVWTTDDNIPQTKE